MPLPWPDTQFYDNCHGPIRIVKKRSRIQGTPRLERIRNDVYYRLLIPARLYGFYFP